MTVRRYTPRVLPGSSERIDEWVRTRLERDHIPAMSIGVYRYGEPIFVNAYGVIDLEHDVPAHCRSPFEICSVTKQFTAAAILLLAEEGKLRLEDPLTTFFPQADPSWSEIRLEDVLNHTSGLPDIFEEFTFDKPWSEVVAVYVQRATIEAPRTAWRYNNGAYWLLGDVIAQAAGEPIWSYVGRRIFEPLGMTHTFPNSPEVQRGRVRGYSWNGVAHVNQRLLDQGSPAGALVSTPDDLMRWSEALRRGALLKPESRERMLHPAMLESGEEANTMLLGKYGLGVFLSEEHGNTLETHSGGWAGASAQLTRVPEEGLTITVLANVSGMVERPWWGAQVAEMVMGKPYLPAYPVNADPDPTRTSAARAIFEQTKRLSSLKSLQFVRAIPQGSVTKFVYRIEADGFYIAVFRGFLDQMSFAYFFPIPESSCPC